LTIPSISGKTIGTGSNFRVNLHTSAGSDFNTRTDSLGIQTATIDFWGVQVEAGSTATAFQTATGTIQGELAACQRYYQLLASGASKFIGMGYYYSAFQAECGSPLPVQMRTVPTISIITGTNYYAAISPGGGTDGLNSLSIGGETTASVVFLLNTTEASGTAGQGLRMQTNNAAAFLAVQAEI
jgi:hypothetical protein